MIDVRSHGRRGKRGGRHAVRRHARQDVRRATKAGAHGVSYLYHGVGKAGRSLYRGGEHLGKDVGRSLKV